MLRPILFALTIAFTATTADAAVTDSAPQKQQLVYKVQHSKYGSLGTYTNIIERNGETATVTTDAKFSVSILGIGLFNQTISRVETWQANRLVGFRGVTKRDGKAVELSGKADGDKFVMTTPEGTTTAPADVRLANPWSKESIEGMAMMTPDRGRLETATISEKEPVTLTIGGKKVRTSHFDVLRNGGPKRYEVWLDDKGTPVQFALAGPEETITFTLAS